MSGQSATRPRSAANRRIISPNRTHFRDLTGRTIGLIEVLSESDERDARGGIVWNCRCKCGTEWKVSGRNLLAPDPNGTRSCGCLKGSKGRRAGKRRAAERKRAAKGG